MSKLNLSIWFLLLCQITFSQSIAKDSLIVLDFSFELPNGNLVLNSSFELNQHGDSAQVDLFRFYVGDLDLYNSSGTSAKLEQQWYLVDASDQHSLQFVYEVDDVTQGVTFRLGVDSLTNDSGVHGGALDPTKGMYWAWQTGYINLKLEGNSSACPASKGGYAYHFGGFLDGLDASKKFQLTLANDAQISLGINNELSIIFEMDQLLEGAYNSLGCNLMRPSKKAVDFVETLGKYMHLDQ